MYSLSSEGEGVRPKAMRAFRMEGVGRMESARASARPLPFGSERG